MLTSIARSEETSTRESGQEVFNVSRVGSDRAGPDQAGSGQEVSKAHASGRVRLGDPTRHPA